MRMGKVGEFVFVCVCTQLYAYCVEKTFRKIYKHIGMLLNMIFIFKKIENENW